MITFSYDQPKLHQYWPAAKKDWSPIKKNERFKEHIDVQPKSTGFTMSCLFERAAVGHATSLHG
jgi:hypothetical protein